MVKCWGVTWSWTNFPSWVSNNSPICFMLEADQALNMVQWFECNFTYP